MYTTEAKVKSSLAAVLTTSMHRSSSEKVQQIQMILSLKHARLCLGRFNKKAQQQTKKKKQKNRSAQSKSNGKGVTNNFWPYAVRSAVCNVVSSSLNLCT